MLRYCGKNAELEEYRTRWCANMRELGFSTDAVLELLVPNFRKARLVRLGWGWSAQVTNCNKYLCIILLHHYSGFWLNCSHGLHRPLCRPISWYTSSLPFMYCFFFFPLSLPTSLHHCSHPLHYSASCIVHVISLDKYCCITKWNSSQYIK